MRGNARQLSTSPSVLPIIYGGVGRLEIRGRKDASSVLGRVPLYCCRRVIVNLFTGDCGARSAKFKASMSSSGEANCAIIGGSLLLPVNWMVPQLGYVNYPTANAVVNSHLPPGAVAAINSLNPPAYKLMSVSRSPALTGSGRIRLYTSFSIWLMVLSGNDSNLLIVFYVQIMPDDLVMQLHRF